MNRGSAYVIVIGMAALSMACASTGATPRPFPTTRPRSALPGPPAAAAGAPVTLAPAGRDVGYSITGTALNLRGTPYKNGGADPAGFDCSGFVQYVFAQYGLAVPRRVSDQFKSGRDVAPAQLQPGDLVFFTTIAPGASHVGIALGGDEFVHAPSSTGEVRVEHLSAAYWATRFVGARRVL